MNCIQLVRFRKDYYPKKSFFIKNYDRKLIKIDWFFVEGMNRYISQYHPKSEAVTLRCSVKKVILKISQILQENTCARVSFLIKLKAWGLQLY